MNSHLPNFSDCCVRIQRLTGSKNELLHCVFIYAPLLTYLLQNHLQHFGIHLLRNVLCIHLHLLWVWHDIIQSLGCFADKLFWSQDLICACSY